MKRLTRRILPCSVLCLIAALALSLRARAEDTELDRAIQRVVQLAESDEEAVPGTAQPAPPVVVTRPLIEQVPQGGSTDKLYNVFWGVDVQAGAAAFDILLLPGANGGRGPARIYQRTFRAGTRSPADDDVSPGEWTAKSNAGSPVRVTISAVKFGKGIYQLDEQAGLLTFVPGSGSGVLSDASLATLSKRPIKIDEMGPQGKQQLRGYGSR